MRRNRKKAVLNPAHTIVRAVGGDGAAAKICGIDHSSVWRWQVPAPKGGGGKIPYEHLAALKRWAIVHRVDLDLNALLTADDNADAAG